MAATPNVHHLSAAGPAHGHADGPVQAIFADVARLLGTAPGRATIVAGGADEAWLSALRTRLAPGDTVLVPRLGQASERLAMLASEAGLAVEVVAGPAGGTPYGAICRTLRDDVAGRIRAVLMPSEDAGCAADIGAVRALLDRAFHDALLMVDASGSLGSRDFRMQDWGVDVAIAACRRTAGLPEGLTLVARAEHAGSAPVAVGARLVAAE